MSASLQSSDVLDANPHASHDQELRKQFPLIDRCAHISPGATPSRSVHAERIGRRRKPSSHSLSGYLHAHPASLNHLLRLKTCAKNLGIKHIFEAIAHVRRTLACVRR